MKAEGPAPIIDVEGLEPLLRSFHRGDSTDICRPIVMHQFVELRRMVSVPFTTPFLLAEFAHLFQRADKVVLVFDFTHDMCSQRFKLGGLCAAGKHNVRGSWRNSPIPGMLSFANKEVTGAALPMVQALKRTMQNEYNLDLAAKFDAVVLDVNPGLVL